MAKPTKKTAKKATRKTTKALGAKAAKQLKSMGRVRKTIVDLPEPERTERREGYLDHALKLKRPSRKVMGTLRAVRVKCSSLSPEERRRSADRVAKQMG